MEDDLGYEPDPIGLQARWRLGELAPGEVEAAATAWLAAGRDGRCLAELAWARDPKESTEAFDGLVAGAMGELGAPLLTTGEALAWMTRAVATDVLAGVFTPMAGAEQVAWALWDRHDPGDRRAWPQAVYDLWVLTVQGDDVPEGADVAWAALEAEARGVMAGIMLAGCGPPRA